MINVRKTRFKVQQIQAKHCIQYKTDKNLHYLLLDTQFLKCLCFMNSLYSVSSVS